MTACPQCDQPVNAQAVTCRFCGCSLKAHGHPGILLHQSRQGEWLCRNCLYDADDSCTFPQRPFATTCTLYRDQTRPVASRNAVRPWRRYWPWLIALGLLLFAFVLALRPR